MKQASPFDLRNYDMLKRTVSPSNVCVCVREIDGLFPGSAFPVQSEGEDAQATVQYGPSRRCARFGRQNTPPILRKGAVECLKVRKEEET